MTDYWGSWSADQPEFGGPEGEDFGDLTPDQPDDVGFPVEGFGAADPDPGDLSGSPADPPMPLGYDDLPTTDPYAETDPYPAEESEYGPDGYPEVPAEVGFGAADPPLGADPDLDPYADTGPDWWESTELPDLGVPPEPVDGFPWTDPALLGQPVDAVPPALSGPDTTPVGPDELAEYAGEGLPADGDPWSALAASDDPATSTLARFWLPDER
ncbi:hypothetical protein GCM10022225_58870 [Plantactinospora mayteni]|uniref:Uncharacterized protein n=1 Tax=Plantactinospora mayteni TaxID=566021 RepID=A0ABQ4EKJ7_9ACTN|nr:hypothetical protein [Plantactinospora mayteni]GIG95262.1 hypothetical protein Pma05_18350 [Plantactinospora mayteni]